MLSNATAHFLLHSKLMEEIKTVPSHKRYRVVFYLFLPISSTKMKNDGQPIRDYVPSNSRWTKDPRWFLALKLGGTVKKTPGMNSPT